MKKHTIKTRVLGKLNQERLVKVSIEFYPSSHEMKVNDDFNSEQREETAKFLVDNISLLQEAGVYKIDPSANLEVFRQVCESYDFTLRVQE